MGDAEPAPAFGCDRRTSIGRSKRSPTKSIAGSSNLTGVATNLVGNLGGLGGPVVNSGSLVWSSGTMSGSGQTIVGEDATREIWVCGPGAFVVLKSLAFDLRGENKDAYDLFYVLRNYGACLEDVVERLRPLLGDENTTRAIEILRRLSRS